MSDISRRQFLAGSAAAVLAAPLAARADTAVKDAPQKITKGTDLVTLGKTGIRTTMLGLGTGTRSGREQRELGPEGFTRMVRYAYDRGIRYIDTAAGYRTHPLVRDALKGLPREEFFIQTKVRPRNAEAAKADIERVRQELDTDYIDSLLIHYMIKKGWQADMRPVMDAFSEAKEKQRVRAVGVSCHGWDPLVDSVEGDWVETHLVRINPFGAHMDGNHDDVAAQMKKMHEKGRGIIGMKIFGETGFDSAEKRLKSLQYVLGLGCVHAFTIGFTSTEQIDETLTMIEQVLT
jgi:predicted aldo/keto reductase-like oxidoreductase